MGWIALFISSTFFTGFLPGKIIGRPGAGGGLIGSIAGFVMQIIVIVGGGSIGMAIAMIVASFLLGIMMVDRAERFMLLKWGPRKRHTGEIVDHDFNQTNIDEVHGQLIAGLPAFIFLQPTFYGQVFVLSLSLVFFRIFDVAKPWPIRDVEKACRGCWGVMLDDTVAGIMAALLISVVCVLMF